MIARPRIFVWAEVIAMFPLVGAGLAPPAEVKIVASGDIRDESCLLQVASIEGGTFRAGFTPAGGASPAPTGGQSSTRARFEMHV